MIQLWSQHSRTGFYAFLCFVLLVFAGKALLGNVPRWNAEWSTPYAVEVCPELVAADPDALASIRAAYDHIEGAGHDGPTVLELGDCSLPLLHGVRFDVGVPPDGARGATLPEHEGGALLSALVVLRQDALTPDLYRHEAWHSIGAAHPLLPSSNHVLHPGSHTGPWEWGASTKGYTR